MNFRTVFHCDTVDLLYLRFFRQANRLMHYQFFFQFLIQCIFFSDNQTIPKKNGNPGRNAKQQTKRDGRCKSDIGYTGYPCYNIVNHKAAGYPDQDSCHQSNDFRLKDRDYSDNKPDQIT